METPEEFANRWLRGKPWREKLFFERLPPLFLVLGLVFAFFDKSRYLSVPFLLTSIALLGWKLAIYAEGILVDLEYIQKTIEEGQDQADNDSY